MKKLIEIIFLIAIIILGIIQKDYLVNTWQRAFQQYFPCKQPIYYSIGTFDTRFGISKEQFIDDLASAEKIWKVPTGINLFQYSPNGNLKVNLIYDSRQLTTDELSSMNSTLDNGKESYDKLTAEYKQQLSAHNQKSLDFEKRLTNFDARRKTYESEVAMYNRQGTVSAETRNRLNNERDYLNTESSSINQLQSELDDEVTTLNAMIANINKNANSLNTSVNQYNSISAPLSEGFNEGIYKSDSKGQEIDVYQFSDDAKLIRVLAHELGHAIGMEHVDDSEAIMYKLNTSANMKATESDLGAIKAVCKIK